MNNIVKIIIQMVLVNTIIILNMVNVIKNWNKKWIPAIIAIILFTILFFIIDFEFLGINKKLMLFITVAVGLGGPLMESIIIHFTKEGSWKYGNPSFNWYVPLDLLPGYSLLGFGIIMAYFILKKLLVEANIMKPNEMI
jgi:hypothetical protein